MKRVRRAVGDRWSGSATARSTIATAIAVLAGACAAPAPAPDGPSPDRGTIGDAAVSRASADASVRAAVPADVRFMQRMIGHHAQALAMTALVPSRTERADLRLVAERISVSQRNEIALMRRWLERRGAALPDSAAHGAHPPGHEPMPGMVTAEQLDRLAAATGAEFERLFLELMIRHHEGALAMVAELLATPGAAQETEVFRLASDVDADQRAEIRRLRALLDRPPGGAPRR